MSGFLGLSSKIKSMQTEHAHKLPIFWGHGTSDMVVKYQWGVDSQALLVGLGFSKLEFHSYPRAFISFIDL
jgi:predicted esterase